jgi:hypothetical protein
MRRAVIGMFVLVLAGCGPATPASSTGTAASPSQANASPQPGSSPTARPSAAALAPLVGQWELKRTCAAIVGALTKAHQTDLIPSVITETIEGVPENAPLPKTWDPSQPCANAKPPTEHSHTFWADGTFNSYDENGRQVDDGTYQIVDDHTLAIGDMRFSYTTVGDTIAFDVVIPKPCTSEKCRGDLGWAFSVAYPGEHWTRVKSGPHVPPGTGSE